MFVGGTGPPLPGRALQGLGLAGFLVMLTRTARTVKCVRVPNETSWVIREVNAYDFSRQI
jgi:hypothetical protein